jgi:hypothetical protein
MTPPLEPVVLHEARGARPGFAALWRYRAGFVALALSIAVHAAVVAGLPSYAPPEAPVVAQYTATLEPPAMTAASPPAAAPSPAPPQPARPRARKAPPLLVPEMLSSLAASELDIAASLAPTPELPASPGGSQDATAAASPPPAPEVVAVAQPSAPVKALEPPRFPVEALPASLAIEYQLTSAIADGRASYEWRREGDHYRISGEAEATGFFTLFLEGRVLQESRGTVTAAGLRPDRFREKKPQGAEEGLDFDWAAGEVTFDRGTERRTTPLTGNTVDWLSMIFQLAHVPPSAKAVDMEVFTQRKMYRFTLRVLGVEEIDIPIGRVKALHLRHAPGDAREAVDVWLGLDYHHVPVKMRYPVARNRLMVDQVATAVTAR